MRILADFHHGDLFYSLQLLFEKRLGAELYRPIGLEWYEQGFWNVVPQMDTACQFLGLDIGTKMEEVKQKYPGCHFIWLNKNASEIQDGCYAVPDTTKNTFHKGITLDAFKNIQFDILISSIPQHIPMYNKLIQLYQPKAKHIFQVGNAWGRQAGIKNILSSTAPFPVPSDVNACFYHQEFDLDVFCWKPPVVHNEVDSYIHYMKTARLDEYRRGLPDWKFRTHGAGMEDCFHKTSDIAAQIQNSGWTFHYKPGGDGYGHTLHNSFAVGRPVIIERSFYRGQIGEKLLEDNVTCVDTSAHTVHENCQLLRSMSNPDTHLKMCEAAHKRFNDVVNFNEEEQTIRKFLENLQ